MTLRHLSIKSVKRQRFIESRQSQQSRYDCGGRSYSAKFVKILALKGLFAALSTFTVLLQFINFSIH
jgi:hypothetical protein